MFRNYLKTAIRNLWRYKGFAAINILSLTIGIIGCLVIALFVWDEKKYDRSIPDAENIYRLYEQRNDNNVVTYAACVPPALTTFLKHEYPEVSATARILMSNDKFLLENGDQKGYEDKGLFVDSTFFQIFPLKLLSGDAATALRDSGSIIISQDLARRYFGNTNPVGEILKVDKDNMMVKGVLAAAPSHFHLNFHYLMSLSSAGIPSDRMER
jgi:putative ABC transport system permease protein